MREAARHHERFRLFRSEVPGDGFRLPNGYFDTPDAEVYYSVIHLYRPRLVIEVGSGNSTWLARSAISDAGLKCRLVSIDPEPRREIAAVADQFIREPVEQAPRELFDSLRENDILFIDSSHRIRTGNDVVVLFLQILPRLADGVLVHIHDIFLPYEYPRDWLVEKGWGWNEQYLAQALLSFGNSFEVLWPGHFLQRHWDSFEEHFPGIEGGIAKSFWLRKLTPRAGMPE